jgi:hypothetical protein
MALKKSKRFVKNKDEFPIRKYCFLRAINLKMKIIDARSYVDLCYIYEKGENIRILNIIQTWLSILNIDLDRIISDYYQYPKFLTDVKIRMISDEIDKSIQKFDFIIYNLKFLPILPTSPILDMVTSEIIPKIPSDELKIKEIYFKNITEFNFEGTKMKEPPLVDEQKNKIRQKFGEVPKVLSMSVVYNNNPLLWPLIIHEYGHVIYKIIKKKDEMKDIIKELTLKFPNKSANIDDNISEIFSDLFAINYYGSSYLFAFYFHEILMNNKQKLLDLDDNNTIKENLSHPPSAIRFEYMKTELKKRKQMPHDDALEKLMEYHQPFSERITKKRNVHYKHEDNQFFEKTYENISEHFKVLKILPDRKDGIISSSIEDLSKNLIERLPISATYKPEKDLREALKMKGELFDNDDSNEIFDIEEYNEILKIIYVGWRHLILDIIDDFYEKSADDYLTNVDLKFKEEDSDILKKIKKFSNQYEFLMKDLIYSIETAIVISNYSGDTE